MAEPGPFPVPVLLVTGFLGAGKTTVVNHLLAHAGGRRIAAVVNDFGTINIDAELVAGAGGDVVSLANGCICCSLEGDLLRTLATLLRHDPRPEAIVIETSGVADPADIVRNLMDPVIWREAPLDLVLCVVDATAPPAALDDSLLRAQLDAADLVALTKTDLADPAAMRAQIARLRPGVHVVDAPGGEIPPELLFPTAPRPATPRDPGRRHPAADRFDTLTWTSEHALDLPRFQAAIGTLAPRLVRAKGFFPDAATARHWSFQLAGGRATLAPTATQGTPPTRLVFIAEIGRLSGVEVGVLMEDCVGTAPYGPRSSVVAPEASRETEGLEHE